MAKTSFVLKEPNATKKTSIVLIFRFDNLTVKISTKQTVEPKFWDKSKQRVRQSINVNHTEINFSLNEMESKILDLFHRVISEYQRKPESLELKNLFQLEYFESKPQFTKTKRKSLLEVFDEYSEKMKSENKNPSAGQYRTAKQNLIDYATFKGCDMQFETLTNSFRNDFINFLRHNKKYSESTLHRRLKFIKTVLYYAIDCRYIEESTIKMNINRFGVPDIQAEKIALSASELKEIENLDLSDNKRLDRVRDKFLIGCYTGLRFSDFIRLNKHHIVDDKYIEIRQEKTEEVVTQPFWNEVRLIFEKYEYNLPAGISEGKFNKYLKEVCSLCES